MRNIDYVHFYRPKFEIALIFQDYLGGIIVFVSIVTALFTAKLYPEAASPSLVALAINYTLLVPIYLNWVVKLLADLEMYIGAVERISLYINPNDMNTSDNDTDENPCDLMTIKPTEKCEYVKIYCANIERKKQPESELFYCLSFIYLQIKYIRL